MARAPFELAGVTVKPGSRAQIDVPVAKLYTHAPLDIPVEVVHGRQAGPTLLVCGAIHGDEINGVEIGPSAAALPPDQPLEGHPDRGAYRQYFWLRATQPVPA